MTTPNHGASEGPDAPAAGTPPGTELPQASQTPADVASVLHRMPHEPLLPAEKKLIVASLLAGAVLLVVLYLVSQLFFQAS